MKLYGYAAGEADLLTLSEATVVATSQELRAMAAFLLRAADRMDELGPHYSHEHLGDVDAAFESSPQFIVCAPADE